MLVFESNIQENWIRPSVQDLQRSCFSFFDLEDDMVENKWMNENFFASLDNATGEVRRTTKSDFYS